MYQQIQRDRPCQERAVAMISPPQRLQGCPASRAVPQTFTTRDLIADGLHPPQRADLEEIIEKNALHRRWSIFIEIQSLLFRPSYILLITKPANQLGHVSF